MTKALSVCLSLAVVVLLVAEVSSFISSWPLKPRCPFRPPRLKLKSDDANRFRGSCRITGWRQDTCKGSRLSCCKNIAGDYLCVRPEGIEKRRKDLFYRIANPFEFYTPELLGLLGQEDDIGAAEEDSRCPEVTSPLDCIYDQSSSPCQEQSDCPEDSVCCNDPCYTGGPNIRLCFPVTGPSSPDSVVSEDRPLISPNDKVVLAPNGEVFIEPEVTREDSGISPPLEQHNKPGPGTEEGNIPEEVAEQETSGNLEKEPSDEIEGQPPVSGDIINNDDPAPDSDELEHCPKPDFKCNESGKCAVVCAGYSPDVTPCQTTDDCAPNRVCCDDPCPNSGLRLCFLKKRKAGVAVKANAKASPPTPKDKKKPPKENKKQNDDPVLSGRFVCPVGDFESCIAWAEVPDRPGTGVCEKDTDCEKGRLCCKITECNDGITHCVPHYDTKEQKPGCPIPQYTAVHGKKTCSNNDECKNSEICCDVDMQGTKACVNPV